MAEYVDNRIKDFANEASSVASDDYIALDGETKGSRKFKGSCIALRSDANIACNVVTDNPEYAYAIVDGEGKFLFGIHQDGSFEWAIGIPTPIKDSLSSSINIIKTELLNKVDKETGKSLISSAIASAMDCLDNPQYVECKLDAEDKVLEGITREGEKEFNIPVNFNGGVNWTSENLTELERDLKDNGFKGGCGDWSDNDSLQIAEPRFAILNFSNISAMPTTKTADAKAILEFWDLNGNYFKKNAIVNAQGNSSMAWVKKNIAIDLCNDEWEGDDTFSLKIGNWVTQDSFHLKAYYTDFFKGCSVVSYKIADLIQRSRGMFYDRPWKKAFIDPSKISSENYKNPTKIGSFSTQQFSDISLQIDDGARCMPDGFPCAVYMNSSFYGVFAFSLKKHRDNYHQNKSEKLQIQLDGNFPTAFWNGLVNWTLFEVRNPKIKKDKDGNTYDGDNPTEIPEGETHDAITNLAARMGEIKAASTTEEKKALFEKYFDLETFIDYEITQQVCYDRDSVVKNCQWITYDGVKWFPCNYDKDLSFGNYVNGQFTYPCPTNGFWVSASGSPFEFLVNNYKTELKARWDALVDGGFLSAEKVKSIFVDWIDRIGSKFFKKEYETWNESPCCRDNRINSAYWELTNVYADYDPSTYSATTTYKEGVSVKYGESVYESTQAGNVGNTPSSSSNYWTLKDYDSTKTYSIGETCWYGFEYKVKFVCLASCTGETPISASYTNSPKELGYYDSYWRLSMFIDGLFNVLTTWYNNI